MASNDKEILSCENKAINSVKSIIRLNSLRWLDTVFKKLSYSLLIAFNFRAVKFK